MKIGQFIRRVVLALLFCYWAAFITFTVAHLIGGGTAAVEKFYWQILYNHGALTEAPIRLNWKAFLLVQAVYLAITVVLLYFEWRSKKRSAEAL